MICTPYLIVVLATLQPGVDADAWWHLRTGRWIVEHAAAPATDPFSAYGEGRAWVAYSWLFEVLLYGLHAALGLAGLMIFQVGAALAVVAALHRLIAPRERHFLSAIGLMSAAALALSLLCKQRPWMFTILFTILTLDVVLDRLNRRRNGLTWLLPFVYVLWANLHIQFIYGLAILIMGCVSPLLDRWLRRDGSARLDRTLLLLTGACFLAVLVNPYHVRLFAVVVEYANQPVAYRLINELKAPEFRDVTSWATLALAAAATFALGRRRPLGSFEILLLAGSALLAFRARRDLWLLTVASTAILATARRAAVAAGDRFEITFRRGAAAAGVVALATMLLWWVRGPSAAELERQARAQFPLEAAAVIRERGYSGPLYNDFDWGGCLIWELPRLPVAIDNRCNLHGDARLQRFYNVWAGGPGWDADPDLLAANVVVARFDTPLAALLLHHPHFERVHADPLAWVFVARQ
jgi:hypothetical protein